MLKNIGSNWAYAIIQIVVMIQLTPIQVKALGLGPNGAWLTVASLTSVLALLILGIPMASVRFIAQHVAEKDIARTNDAIADCLGICLALGAAAVLVGTALSPFFEHTYLAAPDWQTLGPRWLGEARTAYWITVITVSIGFVAQLPYGVMDAHHDFVPANIVRVSGLVLRLLLIVFVLRAYPSLVVVALIQTVVMLTEFAVAITLVQRRWPGVRFRLRRIDREHVLPILSFSVFAMLLNMGAQLAFRSDALVIGAHLDPSQGTTFDVGNKFFPPLSTLVLGIGMVVMPTATKYQTEGRVAELEAIFLKWSKIAYSIALLVGVYLLILGPEFVSWWMGPAFARPSGQVIQVLMGAYLIFLPARGVAVPILMGLGKPARPALYFLAMGVINLVMSLLLVHQLGIVGVAIGTAVPCVLFALAVFRLTCRELGIPFGRFVVQVFGRTTLGVVPAALFLLWLKVSVAAFQTEEIRWTGFMPLFTAGVGAVLVFVLTSFYFVFNGDPHFDLRTSVTHRLAQRLGTPT